jgi:hypothetical protein
MNSEKQAAREGATRIETETGKRRWWSQFRNHPDVYPHIPNLWIDAYSKYVDYHPTRRMNISWRYNAEKLKTLAGKFTHLWRRLLTQSGTGCWDIPFYEGDITAYKGPDNRVGYFAGGYIGLWFEGNFYGVPAVWGWPDYGRADRTRGFLDHSGEVRPENLHKCMRWGLEETHDPAIWRVSPSLWKDTGAAQMHIILTITGVPTPAPWTLDQERHEGPPARGHHHGRHKMLDDDDDDDEAGFTSMADLTAFYRQFGDD